MSRFQRLTARGFGEQGLPGDVLTRLHEFAEMVDVVGSDEPFARSTTDCLLVPLGGRVDAGLIENMLALRYVGILGTGFGGIDVAACEMRGIAVCNVAGYSTDAVAEFCLAMLLDRYREIHRARTYADAGDLDESDFGGTDLRSLRFGIVGAGSIGTRFAEMVAHGLRADVAYWSRRRKDGLEAGGVRYAELDSLARGSDVISVHLASNEATRSMLGKTFLDALPAGATIVATAPLDVFDVEALVERVISGRVVLLTDHPDGLAPGDLATLMSCPGAVVYPSIGYVTTQATINKYRSFVRSIEAFLSGERHNRVDDGVVA